MGNLAASVRDAETTRRRRRTLLTMQKGLVVLRHTAIAAPNHPMVMKTCRRAAYIAVFQSVLPAHDAFVAMWTAGSDQYINVYQLWSWDRRQGHFLGVGISTRTRARHDQSSQLRLVSVLDVPSTQFYGDRTVVRYRVDKTVGVHCLWYCTVFSGSSSRRLSFMILNKPAGFVSVASV